jgi:hypothetical protein
MLTVLQGQRQPPLKNFLLLSSSSSSFHMVSSHGLLINLLSHTVPTQGTQKKKIHHSFSQISLLITHVNCQPLSHQVFLQTSLILTISFLFTNKKKKKKNKKKKKQKFTLFQAFYQTRHLLLSFAVFFNKNCRSRIPYLAKSSLPLRPMEFPYKNLSSMSSVSPSLSSFFTPCSSFFFGSSPRHFSWIFRQATEPVSFHQLFLKVTSLSVSQSRLCVSAFNRQQSLFLFLFLPLSLSLFIFFVLLWI